MLVGGTGFLIDGGILAFLLGRGWPVVGARLVSFTVAVSWTYVLNRRLTFAVRPASTRVEQGTALAYGIVQVLGALTNLGLFLLLVQWQPQWREISWLPLAIGAGFGLAVNYSLARLVFERRRRYERVG